MKNNKVIIKFQGGLGNQLFQYALYEWLRKEYPSIDVCVDLSYYKIRLAHNSPGIWDIFPNVKFELASGKNVFRYSGKIPIVYGGRGADRLNSLRAKVNESIFHTSRFAYLCEKNNTGIEEMKNAIESGYRYFEGFWQDADFFLNTKDVLLEKLVFPDSGEENLLLTSNDVSVHVRRGDYVGSYFESEVGLEYYKKAIKYVENIVDQPHYYFFSDDVDYVNKTFDWVDNKTIISGHEDEYAYVDMKMMSEFKNSIIPNSTFSLWAAYLNRNNPLVIYPKVNFMEKKELNGWVGL